MDEEVLFFEDVSEENEEKGRARFFPIAGGIVESLTEREEESDYVNIDGVKNCMRALRDIIEGNVSNCFIEMSACIGSCAAGPATTKEHRHPVSDVVTINNFAGEEDFKIGDVSSLNFEKDISFIGVHQSLPGTRAIEEILRKMGKKTKEDELNCGSCGYNTCREKATAVYLGKADMTMCLPYLKERAESFSDNIIGNTPNGIMVLNDALEIQQINKSACNILNVANAADVLNNPVVRVMDPVDFLTVATTKQTIHGKRVFLAEYEKYVDETVIYDNNYDVIMIILRDVTQEEMQTRRKEKIGRETVEVTDKVIEKQMRVVQEIASLLGETTAETKIALTNLKETLENE